VELWRPEVVGPVNFVIFAFFEKNDPGTAGLVADRTAIGGADRTAYPDGTAVHGADGTAYTDRTAGLPVNMAAVYFVNVVL